MTLPIGQLNQLNQHTVIERSREYDEMLRLHEFVTSDPHAKNLKEEPFESEMFSEYREERSFLDLLHDVKEVA